MGLDAAAAKIGQAALEASVKATGEHSANATTPGANPEDSAFKQMLGGMEIGADFAASIGVNPADLTNAPGTVQSVSADGIVPLPEWLEVSGTKPSGMETIVDLLSEVNHGQMRMDGLLNEILYGSRRFSNQELLAIQAHMYHFSQLTEMTVKVAEQGVSSVKNILNTQVQ